MKWTIDGTVPWEFLNDNQRQEIIKEWPDLNHENHKWSREPDMPEITINEVINFTIINPNDEDEREKLTIEVNDDKTFVINDTPIDAQQLAELGMLFFALANRAGIDDLDSCVELLDGFDLPVPTQQLKEIANNGNG